MMRHSLLALLVTGLFAAPLALADEGREFPATLAGHALLPANSFIATPANAPQDLQVSGKYTTGKRVEALASVPGLSNGRPTGISLPFKGQPLQGHSGIKVMKDGTVWLITDNGAGSKANSPDFMLYLNQYKVDYASGRFEHLKTIFLHDPDKKVPFRIVHEGTRERYLTGSDFDTESFQFANGALWIGDEFGPFLIKADLNGKVLAVFDTVIDGKVIRSPDHPAVTTPAMPGGVLDVDIKRSKGFEGMASSKDGRKLYALLEGPLWNASSKSFEMREGKEVLRIVEFDVTTEKWTGRWWLYPLEANGHAIGDFNMVDASHGLIIERDNGEGTADKACREGQRSPTCFSDIAKFKRVYKVELNDANVGKPVRKIGYIDLMNIADPNHKARVALNEGKFTFPFFTIENVDVVDSKHIVVGNDNNLPFSSSRDPQKADDNELVLLEVSDLLNAR